MPSPTACGAPGLADRDSGTGTRGIFGAATHLTACHRVAGYEARGKQDDGPKATTATKVKTVDKKKVPETDAQQTGRQATMVDEKVHSPEKVHSVKSHSK